MKPKKILIVEDEATSRKIISLALEGKDRELLYAKDGDEAVRMTLDHRPDLIIMDVMLPRINGYEAARIIKSNNDLKHIPLVAVTARTADYDEAKAREAGCDDYITKPYRVGFLRDRLARYLADE
jgi:CheY-like chemotaxis protein